MNTILDGQAVKVEYEVDRFGDVSLETTFVYNMNGKEIEIETLSEHAIWKLEEIVNTDFASEMIEAARHYCAA